MCIYVAQSNCNIKFKSTSWLLLFFKLNRKILIKEKQVNLYGKINKIQEIDKRINVNLLLFSRLHVHLSFKFVCFVFCFWGVWLCVFVCSIFEFRLFFVFVFEGQWWRWWCLFSCFFGFGLNCKIHGHMKCIEKRRRNIQLILW